MIARFIGSLRIRHIAIVLASVGFLLVHHLLAGAATESPTPESAERGGYIFTAAGCVECHTDKKRGGAVLAGGRALATPFGTFYSPNITPDPTNGIGSWTKAQFHHAIRDGVGPHGRHYFPVFPYPSFTNMTDQDIADLFAYLKTVPAAAQRNKPHEIDFPFGIRTSMVVWNWLYLQRGPFEPDPSRPAEWNRGAYLVNALGHCGECHTPRNRLGALDLDMALAGSEKGPDGHSVPNLTPDRDTGLGKWSAKEIAYLLETGFKPNGDVVGASMGEVVDTSTSKLTDADRMAIATYLQSLPPIRHQIKKSKARP